MAYSTLMGYYFFPKAFALLSGVDLDLRFQLVKKLKNEIKDDKTGRKKVYATSGKDSSTESVKKALDPSLKNYCPKMPNNIDEAEKIIQHYHNHVMLLTQLKMGGHDGVSSAQSSDYEYADKFESMVNTFPEGSIPHNSNLTVNGTVKAGISREDSFKISTKASFKAPFKASELSQPRQGSSRDLGRGIVQSGALALAAEAEYDSSSSSVRQNTVPGSSSDPPSATLGLSA